MSLSEGEVEKLAELARLELSESERKSFRDQISSILDYVGQLSEVEVDQVEPMSHGASLLNVLREDEVCDCGEATRQGVVDGFPDCEDDLLKVKAVFS